MARGERGRGGSPGVNVSLAINVQGQPASASEWESALEDEGPFMRGDGVNPMTGRRDKRRPSFPHERFGC